MSLALRLLLALAAVSLIATALAGSVFRHVVRGGMERGFEQRSQTTAEAARDELAQVAQALVVAAAPKCARMGGASASFRWRAGEGELFVHCERGSVPAETGAPLENEPLRPLLERIGRAYGAQLLLPGEATGDAIARSVDVPALPGLTITAAISRQPLRDALAEIDSSIVLTAAIAVFLSVAVAAALARSISRPIAEICEEIREVMRGASAPIRRRGNRELRDLCDAFNEAIVELSHMRLRLARTERIAARRELARQIAHEIKNPLAPIRAAVETLRRLRDRGSPEFDGYFDEATKMVLAEVHRIKTIVSEFADFARMPPPRFSPCDLEAVTRAVATLHAPPQTTSGPQVLVEAEPLPPIMADEGQLTQLLTNLVQNGIEAGRLLREVPSVTVSLRRVSARDAAIVVRDNGPGIDPEVAARLFEPYVTTKKAGTGLGLAIAQTIAHEHGGEIRALAPGGQGGAAFEVILPIDGPPPLEKAPAITVDPERPAE